ncbi:MAG: type II 3-dehydroquinate dehydratase [Cetobacterium sp.]|uniref:type II 3-dehydroquinate dehydratase n=1 Tax=unclassified Cetobacterium TaxID=2630983 RepID=UPI00163D0BFB|nr:type II 3-dehydroquinate dehydratase [Cetobacterium sp. 2A]MBC2856601.1 type II 3-dehydroquinate dehydratase [Cetobacterium sp. 2A]
MKILVINGPNLNLLGTREPEIYGDLTLDKLNELIRTKAKKMDMEIEFFQSNHEGAIVDKIQESLKKVDYLIINPAALTHYSISIRDAILSTEIKTIEVHISNVYKRESFRHNSVLSDIVIGKLVGFGYFGYLMALDFIQSQNSHNL